MKKNPLSAHIDVDAFNPATSQEKEYMVQMRPSSTFFKDGVKRLWKNKVAVVSFFIIVILAITCIVLPIFWPYQYDKMVGMNDFGAPDASCNYLAPFEYGTFEREKMLGKAVVSTLRIYPATPNNAAARDKMPEATKAKADELYNLVKETVKTKEDFAKLRKHENENPFGTEPQVEYKAYKDNKVAKTTYFETEVAEWIWNKDFKENARKAGDMTLIQVGGEYHIVFFDSYTGETESVFPHILGTDKHGRDFFIRVVYGLRVSLGVGLFASIIVLIIGMLIGAISGYCGGTIDMIIMRIVDIIYSLPDMLIVILLSSVLSQILGDSLSGTVFETLGSNLISMFIVFGLLYWVSMARLIRGQILSLREQEYVLSARASGAKSGWIIRKHLIPNCISVIIISTALQIPSAIFTESYLSFLGMGVKDPMPSLGSLANEALDGLYSHPSLLIIPAIVISLIVLSLNLFGDGLRDAFDPKLNK